MSRIVQKPKLVGETRTYAWDFSSQLAVGETLSTSSMTATVYSGTDASPSSILSGTSSISGNIVSQNITGGVAGVIYLLRAQVTTSSGETLQLTSFLFVEPDIT